MRINVVGLFLIFSKFSFQKSADRMKFSMIYLLVVGAGKEWKAKPTQVNSAQVSGVQATSDIVSVPAEAVGRLLPPSSSTGSDDALPKLQKKLEDLHFSDTKLVIIPNHLQVPESERSGFSFGSFDANFGLNTHSRNRADSEKSSTPLSETSQEIEENVEEPSSRSDLIPSFYSFTAPVVVLSLICFFLFSEVSLPKG